MVYAYTADGLVDSITETDEVTVPGETIAAVVSFEYDNRSRLTSETRTDTGGTGVPPVEYNLSYTYDLGGNRLTKCDWLTSEVTYYYYDITNENDGGQHNNRLLHSKRYGNGGLGPLLEERWYLYGPNGNTTRLVQQIDGEPQARAYWFYYHNSGSHLWMSISGCGDYDAETTELTNTTFDLAAEYRYDSARQRYMVRPVDPYNDFAPLPGAQWRDYLGEDIYGDHEIDPDTGDITLGTAYLPGVGFDDPTFGEPPGTDMPAYFGADQIGTTRRIMGTDSGSGGGGGTDLPLLQRKVYTAFGEPVDANGVIDTRYGYAGAWGYESAEPFDPLTTLGWLHVGHRYYDPSTGRFVQRDPIGIRGGLNVYVYVVNQPLLAIDWDGQMPLWLAKAILRATDWDGDGQSWLDDPDTVKKTSLSLQGGAVGLVAAPFAGAATCVGTWLYAAYRVGGGSTGNRDVDAILDGFSVGVNAPKAAGKAKQIICGPTPKKLPWEVMHGH